MKTVIMKPNCSPEIVEVENVRLETSQKLVEGNIELCIDQRNFFGRGRSLTAYCNEEGKFMDLAPNYVRNGDVVMGTIVVWATDSMGEDHPLTDDECKKAMSFLKGLREMGSC